MATKTNKPTKPSTQIVYREDEEAFDKLGKLAESNNRQRSDEVRAATLIYLDLVSLATLRMVESEPKTAQAIANIEYSLRENIGRVLLGAVAPEVAKRFEADADMELPLAFDRVHVPFEDVLDWTANGKPKTSGS